jgi:hypothetical protein
MDIVLGVPVSRRRVRAEVETFVRARGVHAVRATLNENLSHITGKSGALLQAQGIFIVVATYALDQGWSRYLALSSLLLLIVSALAVMTNLRTVFIGLNADEADDTRAEIESAVRTAEVSSRRGALFNIALYLTFLSVLLLGIGAILFDLNHTGA